MRRLRKPNKVSGRRSLASRFLAAAVDLLLRLWPPRPISADELNRAEFSTHPGGKGLRFTRRLRGLFRPRWLRPRR